MFVKPLIGLATRQIALTLVQLLSSEKQLTGDTLLTLFKRVCSDGR